VHSYINVSYILKTQVWPHRSFFSEAGVTKQLKFRKKKQNQHKTKQNKNLQIFF